MLKKTKIFSHEMINIIIIFINTCPILLFSLYDKFIVFVLKYPLDRCNFNSYSWFRYPENSRRRIWKTKFSSPSESVIYWESIYYIQPKSKEETGRFRGFFLVHCFQRKWSPSSNIVGANAGFSGWYEYEDQKFKDEPLLSNEGY